MIHCFVDHAFLISSILEKKKKNIEVRSHHLSSSLIKINILNEIDNPQFSRTSFIFLFLFFKKKNFDIIVINYDYDYYYYYYYCYFL